MAACWTSPTPPATADKALLADARAELQRCLEAADAPPTDPVARTVALKERCAPLMGAKGSWPGCAGDVQRSSGRQCLEAWCEHIAQPQPNLCLALTAQPAYPPLAQRVAFFHKALHTRYDTPRPASRHANALYAALGEHTRRLRDAALKGEPLRDLDPTPLLAPHLEALNDDQRLLARAALALALTTPMSLPRAAPTP